jgi:hypothetical protein
MSDVLDAGHYLMVAKARNTLSLNDVQHDSLYVEIQSLKAKGCGTLGATTS